MFSATQCLGSAFLYCAPTAVLQAPSQWNSLESVSSLLTQNTPFKRNGAIRSLDHEYLHVLPPSPMQCAEYPLTVKSQIGGVLRPGCTRLQTPVIKNDIAQTTSFSPSFSTGTTSLSNWLAEHPQAVFVPPAEGHDFREAHVFDVSPKFWHDLTPRATRNLLSPVANPEDTVIDCKRSVRFVACTPYVGRCRRPRLRRHCAPTYRTYCVHSYCYILASSARLRCTELETLLAFCAVTPNYSVVGETPLRISDFYGVGGSNEGHLQRRNLRFLVVLREPVARTISSWEYKSERECMLPPRRSTG